MIVLYFLAYAVIGFVIARITYIANDHFGDAYGEEAIHLIIGVAWPISLIGLMLFALYLISRPLDRKLESILRKLLRKLDAQ